MLGTSPRNPQVEFCEFHPSQASTIRAIDLPANRFELSSTALAELAIERREAQLANNGALVVVTGERTGRSPADRFIVKESTTQDKIAWGAVNQPIEPSTFDALWRRVQLYMESQDAFVAELHVGAHETNYQPIHVTTELAWHGMFARSMFIEPASYNPLDKKAWRLLSAPGYQCVPERDGTNSDGVVVLDFEGRRVLLAGMYYAGEMKKAMFSVQNFLLPEDGVLPMHCSASVAADDNVALFFGLSGTGKTTLSADPEYFLIGDDEHGWGGGKVFNLEGGCYAKCVNLSKENEPMIWNALSFGAILENVILDPETREPDYTDTRLTENTRACYPLDRIEKRVLENQGREPHVVIFLTCDVSGVLPPVAILSKEAAAYHYLSGYTARVGSTEVGSTEAYSATFSACFGEAFLPRPPGDYANLLMERIESYGTHVFLVNTGWTGGGYGVGKRFDIPTTRAIIRAIRSGSIDMNDVVQLAELNLEVPCHVPGVDTKLLSPRDAWSDKEAYDIAARELIEKFRRNFQKFDVDPAIATAGP